MTPKQFWTLGTLFSLILFCSETLHAGLESLPPVEIFGFGFNHNTVVLTGVIALGIYLVVLYLSSGYSKEHPTKKQTLLELFINFFNNLSRISIGRNRCRWFFPFIASLFIFLWCCNLISLIPVPTFEIGGEYYIDYNQNGIYDPGEPFIDSNGDGIQNPGFRFPGFEEPTSDLNVPLALTLLFVTALGQGGGIRYSGIIGYLKSYLSPGGFIGLCMLPLNIIGKIAQHVSICFRIFGNLFGGAIIMTVINGLIHYMILPIGMFAYFGAFAGTIQAFVFTMLSITYISMEVAEEG